MRGMTRLSRGLPDRVDEAFHEQRHHVERGPADVHVAGGVGVAHRDGVVDQHQLDLELLAVGRLPDLAGLEAVVGEDDRRPAGPDVEGEADRVVLAAACRPRCPSPPAAARTGLNVYSLTVVTLAVSWASAVRAPEPPSARPPAAVGNGDVRRVGAWVVADLARAASRDRRRTPTRPPTTRNTAK